MLGDPKGGAAVLEEVVQLRQVVQDKLRAIGGSLEGNSFPVITGNLWLGPDEATAAAQALQPKLEKTRKEVQDLLFEVVALEVRLLLPSSLNPY